MTETRIKQQFVSVSVILVAGFAAYFNSLQGPFIFDDIPKIVQNQSIQSFVEQGAPLPLTPRFMVDLTLALNYALGGLDVFGYHLLNLVIHLFSALLLFALIYQTLSLNNFSGPIQKNALWIAMISALLWTVHPLQTESVTYVIQRSESLMALFYLGSLFALIKSEFPRRRGNWQILAVLCCWLGMATKQVMVTAPVVMLLYDRTFLSGTFKTAIQKRKLFYLFLFAGWGWLFFLMQSSAHMVREVSAGFDYHRFTWLEYALTQPGVILHYLYLSVWPHPLVIDYYWPVATKTLEILPPLCLVLGLFGGSVYLFVKRKALGFLGLSFFLILAPTSSILPIADIAFEHRMYLPLAPLMCMAAVGLFQMARRRIPFLILTGLIVVVFTGMTYHRNQDYSSVLSIWTDNVHKRPENPRTRLSLGKLYYDQRELDQALEQFQEGVRLRPDLSKLQNGLGVVLRDLGRQDEAVQAYRKAIEIAPDYAEAHYGLGVALRDQKNIEQAIESFKRAIELKPNYTDAYTNLGNLYSKQGRNKESKKYYELAAGQSPESVTTNANMGLVLAGKGKTDEAIRHYQRALQVQPDNPQIHYLLGDALDSIGKKAEAKEAFIRVKELDPDFAKKQMERILELIQTSGGREDDPMTRAYQLEIRKLRDRFQETA